jgi:putative MATE family efflux protein
MSLNQNTTSLAQFWKELKEALRGSEADYTKISVRKAIFLLSIPMILELVLESVFAVVDIFFVGKLGASAVATVGLTETYLFLLYSIAMGLATAVTAIVARRVGEGDREHASDSAAQTIYIGISFALPIGFLGVFFSNELLAFMGADQWALTEGKIYTQWMLGGNIVIFLLFLLNAVFRGAGDAAVSMRVLWFSNGINLILDPILIFGFGPIPALGIAGAAISTNVGRGLGVLYQLWILFQGGKHIKVMKENLALDFSIIKGILTTSIGGIGQMFVGMCSWIFIMRILSEFGATTVAGATIALRIMMFTLMPAWGMSNAAATLVGQNLGAGQPDRAEKSVWIIGFWNMGFLVIVSIFYFFFRENLISFFSSDPEVIKVGGAWLKIVSYAYFIYAWWMVATQAFNGSGDTMTPTKINIVFFWMFQIPLAYYLGKSLEYGYEGVFWAMMISESSVGVFTLWLFSKGNWKKTVI